MGLNLILKAFIAVIIGGFGSVPGAVLGGVIIGLLEILVAVFVSSVYKDAINALADTILGAPELQSRIREALMAIGRQARRGCVQEAD